MHKEMAEKDVFDVDRVTVLEEHEEVVKGMPFSNRKLGKTQLDWPQM